MNFETSNVSLAQVVAVKLYINESKGVVFHDGSAAASSLLIAIDNLYFNLNFKTGYVPLAQAIAAKLYYYESKGRMVSSLVCRCDFSLDSYRELLL